MSWYRQLGKHMLQLRKHNLQFSLKVNVNPVPTSEHQPYRFVAKDTLVPSSIKLYLSAILQCTCQIPISRLEQVIKVSKCKYAKVHMSVHLPHQISFWKRENFGKKKLRTTTYGKHHANFSLLCKHMKSPQKPKQNTQWSWMFGTMGRGYKFFLGI